MEDAKYLDLMAKYLSGNITGPERRELYAWVAESEANRIFFDEMIQLWSIAQADERAPFTADVGAAWNRLEACLPQAAALDNHRVSSGKETDSSRAEASPGSPSAKIVRWSNRRELLRAAAVILLLITAGWWLWNDPLGWRMVAIQTAAGERHELTLPDGSRVWLNEKTTLTYRWPLRQRDVALSGEAFFEVTRNPRRPFTILSEEARTTVLGTSFNVRAYPGEERVEVAVKTGRVKLEDREQVQPGIDLEKGEVGVLDRTSRQAAQTDQPPVNADAWKTRTLNFDSLQLRDVIPALERYYDIRITFDDERVLDCPIYGVYTDTERKDMIDAIDFMLVDVTIEATTDSTFVLHGQGCR